MRILSWNIQAGQGVDGRVDLARIAHVIRAMGDVDVICLQEVAVHVLDAEGRASGDQPAQLHALFPDFSSFFGASVDRLGPGGERTRFGNLVLSRCPVLQCFCHPLPQPADPDVKSMPRQATEVVVAASGGALRVVTTHLEFHSHRQRMAQCTRLKDLSFEVEDSARHPAASQADGLYAAVARPASSVLCGDFNFDSASAEYQLLVDDASHRQFFDAWHLIHPQRAHAPTCGIHDHAQWPQGAHCRDFFFVSPDLTKCVEMLKVDVVTDASDHQPLLLQLTHL